VAYSKIYAKVPSKLLIHTNPNDKRGMPLTEIVDSMGMESFVSFSRMGSCQLPMSDLEMAKLYRNFSVLVSTSGADSVNLPLLEAGACGIPSIAVDVPGPVEYMKDSVTYIPSTEIYTSGFGDIRFADTNKLADAMLQYYTDENLRKDMAKKALDASMQWSWERSAAELDYNLRKLL
jgi:glycosyltransferase involved in cell wall biosynthesis